MSSYWKVEDTMRIGQKFVSIPSENGLEYEENQKIQIFVDPSTKYMDGHNSYLEFYVKIELPSGTPTPTRLQLDEMGAASLISESMTGHEGNFWRNWIHIRLYVLSVMTTMLMIVLEIIVLSGKVLRFILQRIGGLKGLLKQRWRIQLLILILKLKRETKARRGLIVISLKRNAVFRYIQEFLVKMSTSFPL